MRRRKKLADRLTYFYRKVYEHNTRQLATGKAQPLRHQRLLAYRAYILKEVGRGWDV